MKKILKINTSNKCRFCGGKILVKYAGLKDKLLGVKRSFNVVECVDCGFAFTNPMPWKNLDVLYPKEYLSDRQEKKGFDFEKWYREDRYGFDFKLVKKATGLDMADFVSYLDVGCGTGEQLVYVKNNGCFQCCGLDKFDHIKGRLKDIIKMGIEDYYPKKKYNVVSLFAVLEHVVNPGVVLRHIRRSVVKNKGYLIISVPNYGSVERKFFGKRWYCLDVPRHLWHYNEKTMTNVLEKNGFMVVRIYKKNAWLHPVSLAPSIFPDADMGKVWGEPGTKGHIYWFLMRWLWLGLTVLSMPVNWILSLLNQASTMMIIAKAK